MESEKNKTWSKLSSMFSPKKIVDVGIVGKKKCMKGKES